MNSGFEIYEELQGRGASPHRIYLTAKADGLGEVELIRLLRTVCGLSLGEAKQVSGALETWTKKQEVSPGAIVYWEGSSTADGFYLMQGRVTDVQNGVVSVGDHKKLRFTKNGIEEVSIPNEQAMERIPTKYFDKTLTERFAEALDFWNELTHTGSKPI